MSSSHSDDDVIDSETKILGYRAKLLKRLGLTDFENQLTWLKRDLSVLANASTVFKFMDDKGDPEQHFDEKCFKQNVLLYHRAYHQGFGCQLIDSVGFYGKSKDYKTGCILLERVQGKALDELPLTKQLEESVLKMLQAMTRYRFCNLDMKASNICIDESSGKALFVDCDVYWQISEDVDSKLAYFTMAFILSLTMLAYGRVFLWGSLRAWFRENIGTYPELRRYLDAWEKNYKMRTICLHYLYVQKHGSDKVEEAAELESGSIFNGPIIGRYLKDSRRDITQDVARMMVQMPVQQALKRKRI